MSFASQVDVVLVSPRNPLNIGAVARAMANFGFEHLSVAAPYTPHWREAKSAVGAPELLANAGEFPNLAGAVARCTFVIGTGTLTHRKPEQPVVSLPDLLPFLKQALSKGDRAALVFGPEKHGLTREDLSYCHVLVEIPTDPRQPSMNLGQAAAVCLYELSRPVAVAGIGQGEIHDLSPLRQEPTEPMAQSRGEASHPVTVHSFPPPPPASKEGMRHTGQGGSAAAEKANSASLDRLASLVEEVMLAANYSPETMLHANRHDVRVVLRRLAPSAFDTRRMMGLFRRILNKLKQN